MKGRIRGRQFIPILMCLCMIITLFAAGSQNVLLARAAEALSDQRLHFIVRHWHVDEELNKDDLNLVEGYIVPLGTGFALQHADGTEMTSAEQAKAKITFNASTGAVTVGVSPALETAGKVLEEYSATAISAGHELVTESGTAGVTIEYKEGVHVAKVYIFYKATQETAKLESSGQGNLEQDTEIRGDEKYYSTAPGLHTDKTASEAGADGRTYNLTLESWFAGDDAADIGLVLDASGSMAFTSVTEGMGADALEKYILTSEQLAELNVGEKEVLTAEQVDALLDKNYTDNAKLSYSGYKYFVYDFRSNTAENVPLGYWGGQYDRVMMPELFSEDDNIMDDLIGYYPLNGNLENVCTGDSAILIKHAKDNSGTFSNEIIKGSAQFTKNNDEGKNGKALDLQATSSAKGALLLDVAPTDNTFTISFAIKMDESTSGKAPIMDLGVLDSEFTGHTYYQIYGTTTDSGNRVRVNENGAINEVQSDINFKDGDNDWHIITYVVNGNSVVTYLDGDCTENAEEGRDITSGTFQNWLADNSADLGIILGGLLDDEDKVDGKILLDELYIFDTDLGADDVKKLYDNVEMSTDNQPAWQYVALDDNGDIISIINQKAAFEDANQAAGWYYINSQGKWDLYTNSKISTTKAYRGVMGTGDAENRTVIFKDSVGETVSFEMTEDYQPAIFYYKMEDGNAVLYCAFNYADNNKEESYETSPVYVKSDKARIKVESLQAALGTFVSKLSEKSPESRVSAVRFSIDEGAKDHLDQLVLLDWTKDPVESAGILSLNRGRSSTSYKMSVPSEKNETNGNASGIAQYNYGLTGGTHTWVGLQAYIDKLDSRIERSNPNHKNAKKYLIIFTDGKDDDFFDTKSNENKYRAIELANELKAEGYTIYCVMLTGGSLDAEGAAQAKRFLEYLGGTKQATVNGNTVTKDPEEGYVFSASSAEGLTENFEAILADIEFTLKEYTVQDYIDPRFNLVDADGKTIYLNAKGEIYAPKEKGEDGYAYYTLKNENSYFFRVNKKGNYEQYAKLYYDSKNEMYYLRWEDVEIPGCSIGAGELSVWKTQITIRAKDDFIGGNAVLSNGHDANMNYVYANAEDGTTKKSSGTDDMYRGKTPTGEVADEYPSKGFPRTTVNVKLNDFVVEGGKQIIYLGETIAPADIAKKLGETVKGNEYWEYLERYVKYVEDDYESIDDVLEELLERGTFSVEYSYLPNAEETNQSGISNHEEDFFGTLYFTWEAVADVSGSLPEKKNSYVATDTKEKVYQLTVRYVPYPETLGTNESGKARKDLLTNAGNLKDGMIVDENYSTPKEAVGEVQGEKEKKGQYKTEIVQGDIHMDMRLSKEDMEYLQEYAEQRVITYSVDLVRSYKESNKEKRMTVGTLTATFDLDNDWDEVQWVGGYTDIPATFDFSSDFRREYVGDNYLPIGTYTLENTRSSEQAPFVFDENITIVPITDGDASLFSRVLKTGERAGDNKAPYESPTNATKATFYLGTKEYTEDPEAYLADRLGWVRIEAALSTVQYAPIVEKVITNDEPPTNKTFSFTIEEGAGNPVGGARLPDNTTISITGEGKDVFEAIEFMQPGTYNFTIRETAGSERGYTYDAKTWTLTVEVVERSSALVVESVVYTQEGETASEEWATFTNIYTVTPTTYTADVNKMVTGNVPVPMDLEYTFLMRALDDNPEGASLEPGEEIVTLVQSVSGTDVVGSFSELTFSKAGTYVFEIYEQNDSRTGYTYDGEVWTLTVTVVDNDSVLEASATYTAHDGTLNTLAGFTNLYRENPIGYTPMVRKKIEGDAVSDAAEFTFTIAELPGNPTTIVMPTETSVTKKGIGATVFGEITFTQAGTYYFTIAETQGNTKGYTYDANTWTLKVEITDEGGVLTQKATYTNDMTEETGDAMAQFVNTYRVEPTLFAPKVTKTVTGDTPSDETFTFTLTELAGNPVGGATLPENLTATVNGSGETTFGEIQFSKAGIYRYEIRERNDGTAGYTYDSSVYTLTVQLADVDSKLQVTAVSYEKPGVEPSTDSAVFKNGYYAEATSYTPTVAKTISGDARATEETFTFMLEGDSTNGSGVTISSSEAKVIGAGKAVFDDIIFTKAGTYIFTIRERDDEVAGYTYDSSVWTLTVTVTDIDAVLQVTGVNYTKNGTQVSDDTEALFENRYTTPTVTPPSDETSETKKNTDTTKTGDRTNIALLITLMVVSLLAVCVLLSRVSRKNEMR